jgi:hypothetical protein
MTMNAVLKNLSQLGQSIHIGRSTPATPPAIGMRRQRDDAPGSYGRGNYAGHSTYTLDFRTQGSYGRGVYAGWSTADHDYDTPGSYGRGSYAGHSTADLDFGAQGRFAGGA